MSPGSIVVLNGELLPRSGARIGVDDAGFLLGDGVFETLRADDGRPQLVEAHLERLERSLASVGILLPWRLDELRAQVGLVIEANALRAGTASVRITVTRGPTAKRRSAHHSARAPATSAHAARDDAPASAITPTVLLTADAYQPLPARVYAQGVDVALSGHCRLAHPLHRIKSTSYAPNLWLRREALDADAFDVLQFNVAGFLAEGSCTNVFLVDADQVLRTPAIEDGCLEGVTRGVVLELAREIGSRVELGGIDRARLEGASEVFLTNSLVEVLPVRRAGSWQSATCPGSTTSSLRDAFAKRVRGRRPIDSARSVQREERGQGSSGRASSHE
jgi:branched-chain amino acid aminotransferase